MKVKSELNSSKEIEVRFNELDPVGIVWHGNYVKYFEDGREDFGVKYGLSYPDIKEAGLVTPIVSLKCDYKQFVKYGDKLRIETHYEQCESAKIILNYTIYRSGANEIVATGQTQQVFTDFNGNLQLYAPQFYNDWKEKWGVANK